MISKLILRELLILQLIMLSLQLTNSLALSSSSSTQRTSDIQQQHQWWRCSSISRNAPFPSSTPLKCSRLIRKTNAANTYNTTIHGSSSDSSNDEMQQQQQEEEEEEDRVLTAMQSNYNDIVIVETSKARMLLLDSTHNVHSVLNKDGQKWTGSYWDEFASLPAIVPEGPIAIFGLGGGTAAHLMLDVWPSLELEGWEIDEILIDQARNYFGLSDLEKHNQAGGILHVLIGDALCPSEDDSRRYAGIVIDLFCGGKILSQLQEVATWLELRNRLTPNGRLMVNCGGIDGQSDAINGGIDPESVDGSWVENHTIEALCKAFPEQVIWKRMPASKGSNYLALTGPRPDLASWSAMLPECLSEAVGKWRPCSLFP